jgi:hypothetical protein
MVAFILSWSHSSLFGDQFRGVSPLSAIRYSPASLSHRTA